MAMMIGIAGPITLHLLRGLEQEPELPVGYDHPPMSALVNALLDRGLEVTVFTTSTDLKSCAVFRRPGLTVCVARRQPRAGRDLFRSEREDLVMLMKEHPVDIINAHWSYEFAWAALDSGMPTLVTLRDHAFTILKYNLNVYRFMRLLMNRHVLNRAAFLSTNSRYLYDRLAPRDQRKARVIQNFFSADIRPFHKPYDNRRDAIVSVANGFGQRKNIEAGLHAFATIRESFPAMTYQLIGYDMESGGPAERYARRAGVADGVEFLGKLPHARVLDLVGRAKLMLHSSLEESFGMSVLEAMVVGTPVLAGVSSGNIPSLLGQGSAGVLCDVSDSQKIANAAADVLRNETRARSLAEAAAAFAESEFSEEKVVSSYLDYYAHVLERSDALGTAPEAS